MFESVVNAIGQIANNSLTQADGAQNVQTTRALVQAAPVEEGNMGSFEQALANVSNSLQNKLGDAESLSLQQMSGEDVGVRDVVNSVMSAERSLSTAIAIRDKIVQAYLEISRMQI